MPSDWDVFGSVGDGFVSGLMALCPGGGWVGWGWGEAGSTGQSELSGGPWEAISLRAKANRLSHRRLRPRPRLSTFSTLSSHLGSQVF